MKKEYSEQYKHPNWQKKRLEILQRDDFTCKLCKSKENQLQVHHFYYSNKLKVWEYNNNSLITLCDKCHTQIKEDQRLYEKALISTLYDLGFNHNDILNLSAILHFNSKQKAENYIRKLLSMPKK